MSVAVLRPKVAELVFQVYDRPLHPELFEIVSSRRVDLEDYSLTVSITRTGHVLSWSAPKMVITEVTATADQPLVERGLLLSYRVRGEHTGILRCSGGVQYQMSFQVESVPQEIYLRIHDEIVADAERRGMLHNFQPNHRLSLAPLGFITAEARPRCLIVTTFHTFPDEHTIVKSQTLIERS